MAIKQLTLFTTNENLFRNEFYEQNGSNNTYTVTCLKLDLTIYRLVLTSTVILRATSFDNTFSWKRDIYMINAIFQIGVESSNIIQIKLILVLAFEIGILT